MGSGSSANRAARPGGGLGSALAFTTTSSVQGFEGDNLLVPVPDASCLNGTSPRLGQSTYQLHTSGCWRVHSFPKTWSRPDVLYYHEDAILSFSCSPYGDSTYRSFSTVHAFEGPPPPASPPTQGYRAPSDSRPDAKPGHTVPRPPRPSHGDVQRQYAMRERRLLRHQWLVRLLTH